MNLFKVSLKGARYIYTKVLLPQATITPFPYMVMDADEANRHICKLITDDSPCMIARFGSTELSCIVNYLGVKQGPGSIVEYVRGKKDDWWWNPSNMKRMQNWSGFFPASEEYLGKFCELMLDDMKQLDVLGSWVSSEKKIKDRLEGVYITHLRLLEPFWSQTPWTHLLEGKRVVVVHPFAELIEQQYYNRRTKLFANSDVLPEFKLRTVKAVQSLGGNNSQFTDWFDALEWMKQEIDREDYDIALIGCGAYGFPLAAHAKRTGHKAVHLGGALQLLFGIIGKRWENPNYGVKEWGIPAGTYSNLINEYWVRPGEKDRPSNAQQVEDGCYW